MDQDPQYRVDFKRTPGKLLLIVFALFVIAALVCEYLLLNVRQGEQTALSGELLQGGYGAIPSTFWGRMFEYFGMVVYLLPWLLLFPVWWILNSSFSVKQIDFFKVGIRLLGFNTLLIGLCMLFAGIFTSDPTGAGGTLGEVLYLFSFNKLPSLAASATPVALTFIGIMLYGVHSPWWFCDRIGAAVTRCLPFLRKYDEGVDNSQASADQEKTEAATPKASFHRIRSIFKKQDPKKEVASDSVVDLEPKQDHVSEPQEPAKERSGMFQAPRFFRGKDDVEPGIFPRGDKFTRVEPFFDALNKDPSGISSPSEESSLERSALQQESSTATLSQASYVRDAAYRREFATPAAQQEAGIAPRASSGYIQAQDPHAPSTIISGGKYATPAKSVIDEPSPDEYAMPDAPMHTIITKADTRTTSPAPDLLKPDPRPSSIITYCEQNSEATLGATYDQGKNPSIDVDTVGNPYQRGNVSTVITRSDAVERRQPEKTLSPSGIKERLTQGELTQQDSSAYISSTNGSLMDDDQGMGNFSIEHEYEVESEKIKTNKHPLDLHVKTQGSGMAPMSEHDSAFSSALTKATRGLQETSPEEVNQPSVDEQPYITQDEALYISDEPQDKSGELDNSVDFPQEGYEDEPKISEEFAPDEKDDAVTEVPHAPLGRIPTKTYVSSGATIPSHSDPDDNWRPPFALLKASGSSEMVDRQSIETMIERINKTMQDFGVKAEVANIQAGPVITRYDLKLGTGTRSTAIRQLQTDLTRVLTAQVRVLDVIPGTPFAGLEIPNPKRKLITLRDVVESEQFVHTAATLPLCLGVDTTGDPVVADLAKAPHLLIAGTTGSGKSAGINSMLLSLLLTKSPSELRLILVDPKQVEFSLYEDLPHLICPVISETSQTMAALQWCVGEMERRYKLISGLKLRSISEVNAYIRQENAQGRAVYDPAWTADMGGSPTVLKPIPSVVMVIDEFADLMDAYRAKPKNSRGLSPDVLVGRIAQKARAAGMHLMLATQSPRSNVVTGTLKANLPSCIAYTVKSALDSRVILDESGAEALLGNGDMLAKLMGLKQNQLFRAHGPFASNSDVQAVVEAWHDHCGDPEFLEGVSDAEDEEEDMDLSSSEGERPRKQDVLYDEVVQHCRNYQSSHDGEAPSISSLQVEFGIGYGRAKRLMVNMKKNGDLMDD